MEVFESNTDVCAGEGTAVNLRKESLAVDNDPLSKGFTYLIYLIAIKLLTMRMV